MTEPNSSNRRDFLSGNMLKAELERAAARATEDMESSPSRGPVLLLRTVAMACDFDVMLNPDGPSHQVDAASESLELVHQLEQLMTVYRTDSQLSVINQTADQHPVAVDRELFELLNKARQISEQTDHAFDPASGVLVSLWRRCRLAGRIPSQDEISMELARSGIKHVDWDESAATVHFRREGMEFNLGAIGKGYAVDRAGGLLQERGVDDWLIHGGRSSVRTQGKHAGLDGWPVGIQNPLLPDKPFATLLLRDAALGTSGTAVQWFRHEGKRYGHILDPRTGWPVESMLSVSVIAPDAALADALSTAFFVLGVENALKCCDNFPSVGAILFPPPKQGRNLEPIFHNVPSDRLFFGKG